MYLYCLPRGGFNDQLVNIQRGIEYCDKHNRTLLLDTSDSCYKINWSEYFTIKSKCNIIGDINIIRKLLSDKLTVYPPFITDKLFDIMSQNIHTYKDMNKYTYKLDDNTISIDLPIQDPKETVVVYTKIQGGDGVPLFKSLSLNDNLKNHCTSKYYTIPSPYLGIQIRNTDHKCDYVTLYESNKEVIHSYQTIYVATDCKEALDFFKTVCVNSVIFNFTTFQENSGNYNLHYSTVSGDTKIKDLICDLYMITMCDKFLMSSFGGYSRLMKHCHKNDLVKRMFLDI